MFRFPYDDGFRDDPRIDEPIIDDGIIDDDIGGGGGGSLPPPLPPAIPLFMGKTWSVSNNHLILTSSTGTDPSTTVSITLEEASLLGSGWTARAYTNKSGWRSSNWVTLNTSSYISTTSIPITLGDNEVPNYGQNESFTMYTQVKSPSGTIYTNFMTLSCQITNNHDSTGPEHISAAWTNGNSFSLPAGSGSGSTASRSMYWDVRDLESGIDGVSAYTSVGSLVANTSVGIGSGVTRYIYTLTINGTHAASNSSVSVSFSARNKAGKTTLGTTLYGSISLSDTTDPSVSVTSNSSKTVNLYTSNNTHNNTTNYSIGFSVSDAHSSISSVSVSGNNSTATNTLGTLTNHGSGNYSQAVSVPASNASLGGSASYTYTIRATDSAGNVGSATASFTLNRYDNSAPTASVSGNTSTITFHTSNGTNQTSYKSVSFAWSDHSNIDTGSIQIEKVGGKGYWSHGSWSGNTYSGRWNVSQSSIAAESSSTETFRAKVRDTHGYQGTSSNFQFSFVNNDNVSPSISVQSVTSHTFYSSSSGTTTQTGYVWWSASDAHSSIASASASRIGSTSYISSVGSTNTTSENGAQYKTSYVIVRSVGYGSSYTTRDSLIRLLVSDAGGNQRTHDVGVSLRYIDNTNPYFNAPAAKYHTFYTTQGNSATANMSVVVPVADSHSGIASGTVVKKSGSSNWSSPTNVSLSGGNLNFTIPLSASVLSANSTNVAQTVTMTITDNAGRSVSEDWTGYVRRIDNSGPSISGPSSITDYHFTTTGSSSISRNVDFTVSDAHNSIDTNSFSIYIEPNTYITTSGVSHVSGNTYRYTVTVPRSGKSIHTSSTDFGYTRVTVEDNYDNPSSLTTTHYGTHKDTSRPSINNAQMSGRFDFTTSSFSTTSITRNLTFSCSDAHSSLNAASVTTSSPQVSIGSVNRSGNSYTVPITLTRAGLTSDHGATVVINVSDSAGNSAIAKTVALAGSYVDNKGPTFGTTSISGGSTAAFLLSSATTSITRVVTIPVFDEIQLNTFSVETLGSAKCSVTDLNNISSTSDDLQFTVTFDKNDYALESSQTESLRVTAYDTSNRSSFRDVSFTVKYDDDVAPTISSASTISVDFVQSNSQSSKTVTHSFSVADSGVGPNAPTVSGALAGSVSHAGGLNYTVPITVQRNAFTHYAGYQNVGTITITVKDGAGNPKSQNVSVRAKLTDDLAPSLGTASPGNLSLDTNSNDNVRGITISVSDASGINSSSLEVVRVNGNGTVSAASYSSGNISFNVTTRPSDYTANNSYVYERFRIRIADNNGLYSAYRYVSYYVRVADVTPPVLSLVQGPNFSLNLNGPATSSSKVVIRAIDAHSGINANSFRFIGLAALDDDRLQDTASTQFNPTGNPNEWEFDAVVGNTGIVGLDEIHGIVSVEDNAGNSSSIQIPIDIPIIDNVAPVISNVAYLTNVNVYSSNNREQLVNVTFTVTDTEIIPGNQVVVTKTSSGPVAQATVVQGVSKSGTTYTLPIIVKASALGHNETETLTYNIVARDSVPNLSAPTSISFTVKVIDNVDPVVTKTGSIPDFTLNNTTAPSRTVTAKFSISDDVTSVGNLSLSATSGWGVSRNGGTVTVSKNITHASGLSGSQTVTLTATDSAGRSDSASDTFVISRYTADLTPPEFVDVLISSNDGGKTRLDQNTQSAGIIISGKVTDSGKGVDGSSLKIISSSNGTIASGNTMSPTSWEPATGSFVFTFTWNYNDLRWFDSWSDNSSVIFTEDFVLQVADNEGAPYKNYKQHTVTAQLIRDDIIAPSIMISSVKVNGSDVSSSNPIDLTDRVNGDSNSGFTESVEIKLLAADSQTGLKNDSWVLTLREDNDQGYLTFSSANGAYDETHPSPNGLTVTPDTGIEGGYKINMRFRAPHFIYGSLGSQNYGGSPYGNSNFTITISVSDHSGNTSIVTAPIVINRIDGIAPTIGALQARSGSLNNITVSQSSNTYTHQIKVSASDSQSGIASVVMNNGYSADGTGTESGTLFYYFKRVYAWADIWNNNHPSTLSVSGVKATATDNQGNVSHSASQTVTVTAIDNVDPIIVSRSVTYTQIDLNTEDVAPVTNHMIVTIRDDDHSGATVVAKKGGVTKNLITVADNKFERVYSTSINYEADHFDLGDTTENWTIEVTDSAGNVSTSSFPEITITKEDGTSPIITSVQLKLASTNLEMVSLPLNVASSDPVVLNAIVTVNDAHSSISSVVANVGGGVPVTKGATTGTGPFTIPLTFDPSAVGLHANYKSFVLTITIVATDSAGNSSNYVKSLPVALNDYSPPTISNVTANNVVLNHDHNGSTDPADQVIQLEADVSDVGSGLSNVVAKVTFNTGVIQQTDQILTLYSAVSGHYIWRKTVSADQLIVNASPTDYSFKITATPILGIASNATKVATAQLVDNSPPRCMIVTKKMDNSVLTNNSQITIQSEVGAVSLKYILTAVERSTPIVLTGVRLNGLNVPYTVESSTNNSVTVVVNYTASMVLGRTGGEYSQYADMTVNMIVEDQHDNEVQVAASTIKMEVNDNTDPIVVTQTAVSPSTITVSEDSGAETVTVTASFRDNEEGIHPENTQIVDGNGNNLSAGIIQSVDTVLSNGGKDAAVTAVLSYNFNTSGILYGENVRTVRVRVGDLNGNSRLSDVIAFVVNRIDAVPPTISNVEVRINGNLTQTANISDNVQTASLAISAVVGDNKAVPEPKLSKNGAAGIAHTNFSSGYGQAYGGLYTWQFTIDEDDYAFGTHEDSYELTVTDNDGLSAPKVTKTVTVIKTDVIPPTVILQSIGAVELDENGNEGQSLLGAGNLVTLYTDPNGSQAHKARLKITALVSDEGGLKAGSPFISPVDGWSILSGTPNGTYVWQKDVSSLTPNMLQIIATVNARDTSNILGTPKTATFNIDIKDNTKPIISLFEMTGIIEVNEIPTITLTESQSGSQNEPEATIKLRWSDNGTTVPPIVTIAYGSPVILAETLTVDVTNPGENIYYKQFKYEDFKDTLQHGQINAVTISAAVSDSAGNVKSESITARIQLIDDTVPLITAYNLTGGTTSSNRDDLSFGNSDTYVFRSSEKANGNDRLYLEASVTAQDLRGIASIAVSSSSALSSSPELSWIEVSTGLFRADIGYDDLGLYSTSYPYTITTVVTDNSGQSASASKTIAFSKTDDVIPVATLGSIVGLTNGKVILKSSDVSEKTLNVNINVNENTVGTMGGAQLTGLGPGLDIQLTGVVHPSGSTNRVYSYDVTLDRSDYKFINLTDENVNTGRIANEVLSFSISDAQGNSSGVTQIISIPVELEDDIAPTGSISSDADAQISGGVNKVNLTANSAQGGHKIYVYANFFESQEQTGINPGSIGIVGGSANLTFSKSYDQSLNRATFTATVTSAFYGSLTQYDSYENKTFTVTGKDYADNSVSMPITIGFKRSDVLPPVITNFSISDDSIIHLDEHTREEEKTIEVILSAAFTDERGLSDQYVTYTKNGVLQPVRLPSEFRGPWSDLTFVSVKPDPFDPNASDDVYVFTLHCVDLNNQETTANVTLTVEYDDINNPIIHNANFYEDNAVISQKLISTNGHASQYGISETVQFKARLSDLGDDITQLTVELAKNGVFSNAAITNIARAANEVIGGHKYAVFDVTLTTGVTWSSSLQPITVVLTVTDRRGNSVNITRNLNVAIADESPPVIHSLSLQCFGQNGNNLEADGNVNHKAGNVRGELIVYDESGIDISTASLVSSNGRVFSNIANQSAGTIDGRDATKITFNLVVNYDDPQFNLGANTLTATANIKDTAGQAATPVTSSCSIDKLDQLAPQILGLAFVEDNVTSVKDGAWSMYKIQGTGNANMQGQKSLSSWIVIDTTIPTSTDDQVLLSVGGQEDEHTLIMAIKNHRFTVHVGLNKDETVRNKSAVMSWDMRDDASTNPLHQFRGSTDSVELALLVRLDIGVIMLYANGRLIAAEQARERSFVAYGGSTPTLSVGDADPVANNRSVLANVSGEWKGTISAFNIYDWSSGGSNKVAHESSVVVANVSESKATANGKIVFANLDNEQTTLSFKENNVNSIDHVSTFANVSTFNKNIAYDDSLGDNTQDIPYEASSAQVFDNSYSDSESLTIRKVNIDEESPVIHDLVITHETANGGPKILADSDIVILGSSSTESILITIDASDTAASGVADTHSFSITVAGTTLSTTKLAGSGLQHRLVLDWETLNGITGPGHGDYTLAISAKVVDHAGNESLAKNENLKIRAVDEEAPEITSAVFHTGGLLREGSLENNDLVITVNVSSASPSAEVDMTVKYTDNSHHLTGSAISINPVGSVYPGGPGVWTGSNHLPRGFTVTSSNALLGVYEARMKRTFAYSELSSKGSHQYRMGELNHESWTVTVTDGNNQTHSKNFTINVNVIDDVNPGVPIISLNPANFVLNPGDQQQVTATITTADDNGIEASGHVVSKVELLSSMHSAGANDIEVLVNNANIIDTTPANPTPANKKVFSATFTVNYSHVTGTHSIAKEYKIGARITDLANNSSMTLDGSRLIIEREDTEAPEIVYTKRYHYSANYNAYPALALNSGTYNVVNVFNTISQPDLRFTITDNDALNPASIKMYQSLPIEAISTNPALATPAGGVYAGATEIAMNLVSGVYEPANPVSFNPVNFSKFHRNGEGHSYYIWVRVQAEDMAQNKTELHIPFKVNKVDSTDPTAIVSVNTTQRNGVNEVIGVASGFVTHVANSIVRANLRSDSTHAVVQVRVVASDNDNVKAVGTAPTGNVIQASATGPVMIGGVSTYTIERVYAFNDNDHLGDRFIEDFNVIIEDETGNTRAHRIPVHINGQDVIAPSINITMTTEGNNGSTELKYPGDSLTIVVRAEITDAGSDVNVGTVQLTNASGYSSHGLVDGKYEWRKTVTWSNAVELPLIVTESVSVQAEDNDGNARIVNSSLDYSMTSNLNMTLHASNIYLEEEGVHNLITEPSKSIDPAQTYNVKFEWVISDPNNLLSPSNSDVVITGDGSPTLVGNVTKTGTAGLQTYTAIVAINTDNMTKGENNTISIVLTARDPHTQTRTYELTQTFFVWDYETIDLNNDYYIMYAANINSSITKLRDSNDVITGYKMNARSTAFSNVNPVQVNYPIGDVVVEAQPFDIIKYAAGSNDVVESTDSFRVDAHVYAENDGTVGSEVILEDKTVTISYADEYTLAQIMYSNLDSSDPNYLPAIDAASRDHISRTYGPQGLLGNPLINAVISARVYDQGLQASSPPSVGIVDLLEITSPLDQIAHRNGTFGQNNIMQEGDILVLSGTAPYERKVTDIHGVEHTVVANQQMKLLLRQTAGAGSI